MDINIIKQFLTADTVKTVGIGLTVILSIINVIFTVRMFRKKTFFNTVTKARKEYFFELRKLITEFCYLATTDPNKPRLKELSYQMKLMMNPAGYEKWDREAVRLINETVNSNGQQSIVDELEKLMQSWFALEWHGMMKETQKGVLSDIEKEEIRNKYYREYEKYRK
jgi:hypothetical protein